MVGEDTAGDSELAFHASVAKDVEHNHVAETVLQPRSLLWAQLMLACLSIQKASLAHKLAHDFTWGHTGDSYEQP